MGREVRRVPSNWQHPRDIRGEFVPLQSGLLRDQFDWDEGATKWKAGLQTDYRGWWVSKTPEQSRQSWADWYGDRPHEEDYMPEWSPSEATHYQMYETCSEGTPISPIFSTPEGLAQWLADTKASWFGDFGGTYDQWLSVTRGAHGGGLVVDTGARTMGPCPPGPIPGGGEE